MAKKLQNVKEHQVDEPEWRPRWSSFAKALRIPHYHRKPKAIQVKLLTNIRKLCFKRQTSETWNNNLLAISALLLWLLWAKNGWLVLNKKCLTSHWYGPDITTCVLQLFANLSNTPSKSTGISRGNTGCIDLFFGQKYFLFKKNWKWDFLYYA